MADQQFPGPAAFAHDNLNNQHNLQHDDEMVNAREVLEAFLAAYREAQEMAARREDQEMERELAAIELLLAARREMRRDGLLVIAICALIYWFLVHRGQ